MADFSRHAIQLRNCYSVSFIEHEISDGHFYSRYLLVVIHYSLKLIFVSLGIQLS